MADESSKQDVASISPVQDLIGYPVSDRSTHADIEFHADGTADVTVYEGPGNLVFHRGLPVTNPTNVPRRERRTITRPGDSTV